MQFLLLSLLASTTFALKSPTLCINEKGNEFVCNTVKAVTSEESINQFPKIDEITIGKTGQADLYKSAISLELLRSSLRSQTYDAAVSTTSKSWFQTLGKATAQLDSAKSASEKSVKTIASGLKSLQASIEKTTKPNQEQVTATIEKAKSKLSQELDKKSISYLSEEYTQTVDGCLAKVSKQVEDLQKKTTQTVEKSYDSLIDLTDQIGLCIQSNDLEGKCPKAIQPKLNAVRTVAASAENIAKQFEALGKKSFEKDPCLANALKRLETGVQNVLKTAPQVEQT